MDKEEKQVRRSASFKAAPAKLTPDAKVFKPTLGQVRLGLSVSISVTRSVRTVDVQTLFHRDLSVAAATFLVSGEPIEWMLVEAERNSCFKSWKFTL